MKFSISILALCLFSFISCKDKGSLKVYPNEKISATVDSNHPSFVTNLEFAHEKDEVYKNEMICFNLDMTFGKSKTLMKMFTTPNSSAIRLDKQNGISTIMLDGKIYTNADKSEWENEKFAIYTYHYFFMAPYKFSDPGTKWDKESPMEINGELTNRAKLTFEEGTGNSSNDWYMVHSNPNSKLVEYIGYIVTDGGKSIEEAEKTAHAISYLDYKQVGKVPMSTRWLFSDYDQEIGIGKKIGEGIIRNLDFMDIDNQFSIAMTGEYSLIE